MVRPAAFGWNPETAVSNTFQRQLTTSTVAVAARREFDAMVATLRAAAIEVWVWDDAPTPPRPDAVFPNNWFSTDRDGRVDLFPMATPNRRAEVDPNLVATLGQSFHITAVHDWTHHADAGQFLEGTGSLVLDRHHGRAFVCRSPRSAVALVHEWAAHSGYTPVLFAAHDAKGCPVYHTNVILGVGAGFTVCGLEMVAAEERQTVADALASCGTVVSLSAAQIHQFAGNILQLHNLRGDPVCVLSTTALASLKVDQRRVIEQHTSLLPVEIPTIEAVGGGSARCMLAENFLQPRDPA